MGEFQALEVDHLDLFGSQARDEAGPESDVDVLVHLRGKPTLARLVAVRDRLQALLGRKVASSPRAHPGLDPIRWTVGLRDPHPSCCLKLGR